MLNSPVPPSPAGSNPDGITPEGGSDPAVAATVPGAAKAHPIGPDDGDRPMSVWAFTKFLIWAIPILCTVVGAVGAMLYVQAKDIASQTQKVTDYTDRVGKLETAITDNGKKIDDLAVRLSQKADDAQKQNQATLGNLHDDVLKLQLSVAQKCAPPTPKLETAGP